MYISRLLGTTKTSMWFIALATGINVPTVSLAHSYFISEPPGRRVWGPKQLIIYSHSGLGQEEDVLSALLCAFSSFCDQHQPFKVGVILLFGCLQIRKLRLRERK